jgi:hypothetical protein
MIQKLLRAASLLAIVAFVFPATGCLRMKQDLLVFADGSGKMTFAIGVSQAFLDKLKEMGGDSGFEEKMGIDPEDLETVEGIVAFAKPIEETRDGWRTFTVTAYFEDIGKVKFWEKDEEEKKLQISFSFKKEGDGHVLEIDDRMMAGVKPDEMPEEAKAQIWDQVKDLLKGFEIATIVKMPGKVITADRYVNKDGRVASTKVTEESIKSLDDLGKNMNPAKRKVVCGRNEASDADVASFKKELADAKAAWPKIKEALLAEGAKKKKEKEQKEE